MLMSWGQAVNVNVNVKMEEMHTRFQVGVRELKSMLEAFHEVDKKCAWFRVRMEVFTLGFVRNESYFVFENITGFVANSIRLLIGLGEYFAVLFN